MVGRGFLVLGSIGVASHGADFPSLLARGSGLLDIFGCGVVVKALGSRGFTNFGSWQFEPRSCVCVCDVQDCAHFGPGWLLGG